MNDSGFRFKTARLAIGWSGRQAAEMIGMDERNLRLAEEGKRNVPNEFVEWIEKIAAVVVENPVPMVRSRSR